MKSANTLCYWVHSACQTIAAIILFYFVGFEISGQRFLGNFENCPWRTCSDEKKRRPKELENCTHASVQMRGMFFARVLTADKEAHAKGGLL
jgi:hypothetical protein